MTEYGLIDENGIMTSKMLEPYNECYQDSEGELIERAVSIEEQAETLKASGWKPVDLIDESKMASADNYSVCLIPYDAGDRISYKYERTFDKKAVFDEIILLKKKLSSSESDIGDYKITKCYEASLSGEPLPYDIKSLREERQKVRNRINELEEIIINNK